MDRNIEIRLLELARLLDTTNDKIKRQRATKNTEETNLRKIYNDTRDHILKLLGDSPPLDDIRDPNVRVILKRVRDGNYYPLDKEAKKIRKPATLLPYEEFENFMKQKGIEVTDEEVDEYLDKLDIKFESEIKEIIDPEAYFNRKNEFSTIIVDTRIDRRINIYFNELRMCYVFGQFYAVIGLCRVLLELAFKDKFRKMGLGRKKDHTDVYEIANYPIQEVIRLVCEKIQEKNLRLESQKLYGKSSKILHGRIDNMQLESTEVLDFVKQTFEVMESLYAV